MTKLIFKYSDDDEDEELSAMEKLGPLFILTQVHLWDDDTIKDAQGGDVVNVSGSADDANFDMEQIVEDPISTEDLDLAFEMGSLGLPITFSTTKQMKRCPTKGKRRGMQLKHNYIDNVLQDTEPGFVELDKREDTSLASQDISITSPSVSPQETLIWSKYHDDGHSRCEDNVVFNGVGENDHSYTAHPTLDVEPQELQQKSDTGNSSVYLGFDNYAGEDLGTPCSSEYLNVTSVEALPHPGDNAGSESSHGCQICLELSCSCASSTLYVQDCPDDSNCWEFGEWKVAWDSYYKRYYFYNSVTEDSTWSPPTGLECFTFSSEQASDEFISKETADCSEINFCDAIQNHVGAYSEKCNPCHEMSDNAAYNYELMRDDVFKRTASVSGHISSSSQKEDLASVSGSDKVSDEMDVEKQFDKETEIQESSGFSNLTEKVPMEECLRPTSNNFGAEGNAPVSVHELGDAPHKIAKKRKKRVQKICSEFGVQGEICDVPPNLIKYWCQRYSLFSKFDNGIKMDEEGWFSVTPETVARHHADRCGIGTVIDCFTGVGGNAIQFAMRSNHVVAIDIDPMKIELAQHNAAIYGVSDKINFILGDFFQIASHLKADTVFLSPPWGGPNYAKVEVYDIKSMLKPLDGYCLFKIATMIAPMVVIFLPRNVDVNQLAELSLSVSPPWKVKVEKNILNGKLKAITAYFTKAS